MLLNHLSLPVRDLDEAAAFFTRHFDFEELDRKGDAILVLRDTGALTLVLSAREEISYPHMFHVGFFVEDRGAVDEIHARLHAAGVADGEPPSVQRGRYVFYFHALGDLLLEVSSER